MHLASVELTVISAVLLGCVHCGISFIQQVFSVSPVARERAPPNAHVEIDTLTIDSVRRQ
jgi:hypothetical protein